MRFTDIWKICFAVVCIVLNLTPIVALVRRKSLLKNRSNRHIINVLASHVLFGTALIVESSASTALTAGDMSVFPVFICLYNLATLSIDRYMAIIHPFRYLSASKLTEWFLLLISWVSGFGIVAINKFVLRNYRIGRAVMSFISFFGTLIIVVSVNVRICYTVRKQNCKVFQQEKILRGTLKKVDLDNVVRKAPNIMARTSFGYGRQKTIENVRLFYACFGSTITMLLFYTPGFLAFYFNGFSSGKEWDILMAVATLNSWCDPILFIFFNKGLKTELVNILLRHNLC